MPRHTIPALEEDAPKFKKRKKVSVTPEGRTQYRQDIVPDDASLPTAEGNVRLFLDQALRRFNQAVDAETYNRVEGLKDAMMVDGEGQWDQDIRGRRERKKRPCLTLNRFIPMIAHVANEQRMSRPAIKIEPVSGGADPESALIRQGMIRHIEVDSGAETIYDTAFERMIEKGWSWFRVITDWETPLSHHQIIKIEGFSNDFCVYSDPGAEEPTRKDMKWAFVVYDMPRGEYVTAYPNSQIVGLTSFGSVGDQSLGWMTSDSVRVAEYYYIEETPVNSVRLIGGNGIWEDEIEERAGLWYKKSELEEMDNGYREPETVLPVPVDLDRNGNLITRKSHKPIVKWAKINAVEILDGDAGDDSKKNVAGRVIAGRHIPLVMVSGRERVVQGKRRLSGMVRNNRDAQRMYNYAVSAFVEMIALAPKSPFIAAAGQLEKYKKIWDTANEENWPYLPYDPVTIKDQAVPPPQRQNIEPPVQALGAAIREFDQDLKVGFGIYDPSLGQAPPDQSGTAVNSLQARSDAANMNWLDNMRRAEIYCGELILEQIPFIYDAARIIPIVRPGNKREEIQINQEFTDKKDGKPKNYDMAVGTYSVTVSLGEYASKRQQAVQALSDIAKNVPQVALPLLPLILDNMDSPMAADAAAIVRKMQPAALQDNGSPEQVQAAFIQMQQQHALLVQALTKANDIIQKKLLDTASRERIAGLQAQAQIVAAAIKAGNSQSMSMAANEFQRISQALDQDHERAMAEQAAAHDVRMELIQQAQPAAPPGQPQPPGAAA